MTAGAWTHRLSALATDLQGTGEGTGQPQSGFLLPPDAATGAGAHDTLFYAILGISTFFFVLVVAVMIAFVVKYRRRSADQRTSPNEGNPKLETAWIVIPTIILIAIFVWGVSIYIETSIPPGDSLEIRVTASQWRWNFNYPRAGCVSDELWVPVDKPVRLTMSSTDVIHSLWIPAFRIKRDVLPERYSVVWFEATELGSYDVLCSEYCGTQHSTMASTVHVVTEEEYQGFLDSYCGLSGMSPLLLGERLFEMQGCVACHTISTAGGPDIGPSLYGVYEREERLEGGGTVMVDENYIRQSIMDPNADIVRGYRSGLMPTYRGRLQEDQINALIDYIKSLGRPEE